MAKKRKKKHHKKVMVISSNPRKKRYYKNPVRMHKKRRHKNPGISTRGIMEYIKPIGWGVLGALAINKAVSYIPMKPENPAKEWIKLGSGVAISFFGRKYAFLKWGGIIYSGIQAFNMALAQFPQLGDDENYELVGYDPEDQLLGSQVMFGSQVEFAGEGPTEQDMNFAFNGF